MNRSEQKSYFRMTSLLAVLIMVTVPPAMAQVIQQGIDAFETAPGTSTMIDLPAGFFCPDSAPVSTVVNLTGMPLATNPPGVLGPANTVVERLKNADLRNKSATQCRSWCGRSS